MTKLENFYADLTKFLYKHGSTEIKKRVGDSTNNHRSPTVSQVMRFLGNSKTTSYRKLGKNLAMMYTTFTPLIIEYRSATSRSDAFDINEFLRMCELVMHSSTTSEKRTLSNILTN